MFRYILFNYLQKMGLIFLIAILPISLLAQNPIPNAGFENWTAGDPVGWNTNNVLGVFTPVTQSSNSHSGNFAVQLEVTNFQGLPVFPSIQSGLFGFPVSQAYEHLTGYYQFNPILPSNILSIAVAFRKNGVAIGEGFKFLSTPRANYTQFNVPIIYGSGEVPDTAWIAIAVTDTMSNLTTGSIALIDDLELSGTPTTIADNDNLLPKRFKLEQNYPNPFNPTTTIEFSIPEAAQVQLSIYNQLGEKVANLVNDNLTAGIHRIEWQAKNFPSGVYFYKITAGNFSDIRKMVLLK
jgi:hypothetical protein